MQRTRSATVGLRGGAWAELSREPECGAHVFAALDSGLSPHESCQTPHDGEPQSGPAKAAGRRHIDLGEGRKQRIQAIGRDPDPCIAHFESCQEAFGSEVHQFDLNRDLARLSEFDGIPAQIQKNLPQARLIPHHAFRKSRINVGDDLEALGIGRERNETRHLLHDVTQI